jgi:hypothetical protein
MRIIKLSPDDVDMTTRQAVDVYFQKTLSSRTPAGQFLLTSGRIRKDGVKPQEPLIFSYLGKIVYLAKAGSKRMATSGDDAKQYPSYFCVDTTTIQKGTGTLDEFEKLVDAANLSEGNIVHSQGWPMLADSPALEEIWKKFIAE